MRLALLLCLSVGASAATYTVKAGGGGDYTTIQNCVDRPIANGDTCVVYAGTYNEHVTLSAGGVGAYKTLQVNGTDLVYVHAFTIGSHTKIIGFHIQDTAAPNSADCIAITNAATDIYIQNNAMYACGMNAAIGRTSVSDTSSYVYIQNNTISYPCSTSSSPNVCKGIQFSGDYHLIEGNDLTHVNDGISFAGSHNIFRNNTMHDTDISDCAGVQCHIDFIESEPAAATQYNLIEGNVERNNIGTHGHAFLTQGDACGGNCYNMIERFNNVAHVGSGGVLDNLGGFHHVKVYNNTWVDVNAYGVNHDPYRGTNAIEDSSTYSSQINELFYYPFSVANFFPYEADASSAATLERRSNLAWCTGTCSFYGGLYTANSLFTADAPGNVVADPLFVNYAANNFALTASSPARDAGSYLTTVAVADTSSGTSLVVADASYFQAGNGMTGANADCIAVGTVTNRVCISSINYSTNTITLSSAITRSDGDSVWLYSDSTGRQALVGSAPDIGAYEYTGVSVTTTGGTHSGGTWK